MSIRQEFVPAIWQTMMVSVGIVYFPFGGSVRIYGVETHILAGDSCYLFFGTDFKLYQPLLLKTVMPSYSFPNDDTRKSIPSYRQKKRSERGRRYRVYK